MTAQLDGPALFCLSDDVIFSRLFLSARRSRDGLIRVILAWYHGQPDADVQDGTPSCRHADAVDAGSRHGNRIAYADHGVSSWCSRDHARPCYREWRRWHGQLIIVIMPPRAHSRSAEWYRAFTALRSCNLATRPHRNRASQAENRFFASQHEIAVRFQFD